MKVHSEIQQRKCKMIKVLGADIRTDGAQISAIEKNEKPFYWQRPTVKVVDTDTIHLCYFPGVDYIEHYDCNVSISERESSI